jgi:hypothetical protein
MISVYQRLERERKLSPVTRDEEDELLVELIRISLDLQISCSKLSAYRKHF